MYRFTEIWQHLYRLYEAIFGVSTVFIKIVTTPLYNILNNAPQWLIDVFSVIFDLGITLNGVQYTIGSLSLFDFLFSIGFPVLIVLTVIKWFSRD